ncbi:MAG: methyl-accepting chemotaxis protein [Paracoccaceae bacterium]
MFRLNNIKIAHLMWGLTALLLIVGGVTIGSSVLIVSNAEKIDKSWKRFDQQTTEKYELLGHLRDALGYGGMIHQFKNYVLRHEPTRLQKIKDAVDKAEHAITNYEALDLTQEERAALKMVRAVIEKYAAATGVAAEMAAENATPREIDKVVKIDDGPAMDAIILLDHNIDSQRGAMEVVIFGSVRKLERTADTSLFVVLGLIATLTACFIWLARWRIVLPLSTLSGVIATLAKGEKGVEVPFVEHSDEIGNLARSVTEVSELARSSLTKGAALDAAKVGTILIDHDFNVTYANAAMIEAVEKTGEYWKKRIPGFSAANLVGTNIDVFHRDAAATRGKIGSIGNDHLHEIEFGDFAAEIAVSPVLDADGTPLGHVMQWFDKTEEYVFGEQRSKVIEAAREGNFTGRLDASGRGSLLALSAEGINNLNEEIDAFLKDIDQALAGMSKGDLTCSVKNSYGGRLGDIAGSVDRMAEEIGRLVSKITASSGNISSTAEQILSGATSLSARAEKQAASLEETAAAMEEISATVKANAENAVVANGLADSTRSQAEKGREVVADTVVAMKKIRESATEIGEIVATIEAIAFQTNLLALNAAVEAARAGDAGKGFAVVASEVRALAQRSGEAAKTIKDLIGVSSNHVEEGDRLVGATDTALSEILDGVLSVARTVEEITEASKEQAIGVDEVSTTVGQMDEITQKNATLADRSADASRNLSEHTSMLVDLVGNFSIRKSLRESSGKGLDQEIETWDADAGAEENGTMPMDDREQPDLDEAGNWSEF